MDVYRTAFEGVRRRFTLAEYELVVSNFLLVIQFVWFYNSFQNALPQEEAHLKNSKSSVGAIRLRDFFAVTDRPQGVDVSAYFCFLSRLEFHS